jgi:Rieske 2Fe-2S family protein
MESFLSSIEIGSQGQKTLPAEYFLSPEVFQREQQVIFRNRWVCVAHESDFSEPGVYRNIQLGGESILLVRDSQGILRGHFNVCRHRGTQLTDAKCGKVGKTLQCPYHAWTYSLDGRLLGVPDEKEFNQFSKDQHGLHPVTLTTSDGLVWVHLGTDPPPFEQSHGSIVGRFDRWKIRELVRGGERNYRVAANWKMILQNYSECYHCAPVHPQLIELSPPTSGGNDLIDGPVMGGYMDIRQIGGSMSCSGKRCGSYLPELTSDQKQRVYYYVCFPQMLLSLHPDYVMIHWLTPVSPLETNIECHWFFAKASFDLQDFNPLDAIDFWDRTNREDWRVSELTQRGVQSSRYQPGPYGNRESMPAALDRFYLKSFH